MIDVAIAGAAGRMGRRVVALAAAAAQRRVVGAIDRAGDQS